MTTNRFHVDGDVAVVTGASSGIGRAIAERFAAGGVHVVCCSREQERIDRRLGTSEEIADVVQFLASPAASFLVGETIEPAGKPSILGEAAV